jgi:hypothetical protein
VPQFRVVLPGLSQLIHSVTLDRLLNPSVLWFTHTVGNRSHRDTNAIIGNMSRIGPEM